MKDFSRLGTLQAVTCTLKVVISKKWREIYTWIWNIIWPIYLCHFQWPWMTLKVIQLMQNLSNAIRRTFVRHLAWFWLTCASRSPSSIAELLVEWHLHIVAVWCNGNVVGLSAKLQSVYTLQPDVQLVVQPVVKCKHYLWIKHFEFIQASKDVYDVIASQHAIVWTVDDVTCLIEWIFWPAGGTAGVNALKA